MDASADSVRKLIEGAERDFLMAPVRTKLRTSLESIDAGEYGIAKGGEGDIIEMPRWMGEELSSLNLATIQEEPFEAEISKALSREKMMGPLQLSSLPPDFYVKMKRTLTRMAEGTGAGTVKREDFPRLKTACYDLVGMRLNKLLSLSSSSATGQEMEAKISPEERLYFTLAQDLSKEWKAALLGEKK